MFDEVSLHDATIHLDPGDAIVFYTDGVTEWGLGSDRTEELQTVLRQARGRSAGEIVEAVQLWWRAGAGPVPTDDAALLVVRRSPPDVDVAGDGSEVGTEGFELHAHLTPDAPTAVRSQLRGLQAIDDGLRDDAELLVTELVANAVRHSGLGPSDEVTILVTAGPGYVRGEVSDGGRPLPEIALPVESPGLGESGLGLLLVDRIATRWGVDHGGPGARVWFELAEGEQPGDRARPSLTA